MPQLAVIKTQYSALAPSSIYASFKRVFLCAHSHPASAALSLRKVWPPLSMQIINLQNVAICEIILKCIAILRESPEGGSYEMAGSLLK